MTCSREAADARINQNDYMTVVLLCISSCGRTNSKMLGYDEGMKEAIKVEMPVNDCSGSVSSLERDSKPIIGNGQMTHDNTKAASK